MFEYKNIKINYVDYGKKDGDVIIYLHGWGQNIEMMKPIADPFQKTNRLIIIDLPGFGESMEPDSVWSLDEYAQMVHALVKKLKIKNPNVIGHSFGGKISIIYASKYDVNKLILLSSPFKKSVMSTSLKTKVLKSLAKLPGLKVVAEKMKKHMGSTDYKNASPIMRDMLVKHVNTDTVECVKKIVAPTFIIWGDADNAVSVRDAYELDSLLKDSGLCVYEGCTHYAYLERLDQTNRIIASFIN